MAATGPNRKGQHMPNIGMRALVPSIPGRPSPHGLLSGCVDVVTASDVHQLNGTDVLTSSCAQSHLWQDCPDPNGTWTNPDEKLFDHLGSDTFEPVTVYAGVECSTVGLSFQEAQARAMEALLLGEQRALEEWFMTRWLANADHTVDLTPVGGAVHVVSGIGILENWLAVNYGGAGVIHAPVGIAALLSMHRVTNFPTEESCPETLAGNGLVLGAGYSANLGPTVPPTPPVPAPTDEAWLYITPPVRIRRDQPRNVLSAEWQGINTSINDRRALAETTFVPEVACDMAAAVRVNLSPCC